MSRRFLVIMMFGLPLLAGCVQGSRWWVSDEPTPAQAAILLEPRGSSSLKRALLGESADIIPIRKRLRPCCAFGSRLNPRT